MNKLLESSLSDMQGQLFELSVEKKLDSESFIRTYMLSDVAKDLDKEFNHMQWAGKEYIMEHILDELKGEFKLGGEIYDKETMYWIGYIYRSWHFLTGEDSKRIYWQAPAKTMRAVYYPYHTMGTQMAIERLQESYREKHPKKEGLRREL